MPDVAFVGLTVLVFAVIALIVRGAERLMRDAPEMGHDDGTPAEAELVGAKGPTP